MELEAEVLERVGTWESLSRWERSELGKDLRRLGMSYGEIMMLIDVKKSTLATWCRDVVLAEEQLSAIKERTGSRIGIPVDTNWRRRLEIEEIRQRATEEVGELARDPYWIAGVVLYWADDAKTRNHLKLANTDPAASGFLSPGFDHFSIPKQISRYNSTCMRVMTNLRPAPSGSKRPGCLRPTSIEHSSSRREPGIGRTTSPTECAP